MEIILLNEKWEMERERIRTRTYGQLNIKGEMVPQIFLHKIAKILIGFYFGKQDDVTPRYMLQIPIPFMRKSHGIIYFHHYDKWRLF